MTCMKVARLMNSAPMISPASRRKYTPLLSFPKSVRKRMQFAPIMNPMDRKKLPVPVIISSFPEPKKKMMTVWMKRYRESSPMTEGVRIRLPVMVWKVMAV